MRIRRRSGFWTAPTLASLPPANDAETGSLTQTHTQRHAANALDSFAALAYTIAY